MFDFIGKVAKGIVDVAIDTANTAVNITGSLIKGELPSQDQLVRLLESGVTLYTISDLTGMTVEALQEVLDNS